MYVFMYVYWTIFIVYYTLGASLQNVENMFEYGVPKNACQIYNSYIEHTIELEVCLFMV